MLQKLSFTQAIWLALKGELPSEKEEAILSAVLVASIDHGVEAPSTSVARITASCGVPLSTAVANGVAAIGDSHGGAIDKAAKIFKKLLKKANPLPKLSKKLVLKAKEFQASATGFTTPIQEQLRFWKLPKKMALKENTSK